MKFFWFSFWIRVAYFFRLRGPFVRIQRRFKGEHKATRTPVRTFASPGDMERYVRARFEYRKDETRIGGRVFPLDWITEPEIFQTRLDSTEQKDGDCDDVHNYVAHVLAAMPKTEAVYLMSSGYKGGGHTTCVYKHAGAWFLYNYKIIAIDDPNDAPRLVAEWGTDEGDEVAISFYVFETIEPPWRAVALGRKGRVPV